jgi:hypothetical protein
MVRKLMEKFKDGVSVQEMENFARKYTLEVFTVLTILFASISGMYDFFTGAKMTIVFAAVGVFFGIFFPVPIEKALKQFYSFSYKQEKTTQLILGCVQIVVGLFLPFVVFGIIGLLAGTSYHYYTRHAQILGQNRPSSHYQQNGDEHD